MLLNFFVEAILFRVYFYGSFNYVFFLFKQTIIGKIFWSLTVILLLALGIYWSVQSYNDWQSQQVLTTIKTTAYSVEQLEFPTVTFCSPG